MDEFIAKIQKGLKSYDYGKVGNSILYEMCKKYPMHTDESEIIAKVWIIGRSYAASIERNRNNKKTGDKFWSEVVAPEFKKHFDSSVDGLKNINYFSENNLAIILSVHKQVTDFIKKYITKDNKRSFVSKYLHFHFPKIFFIYDSRVASVITKVLDEARLKNQDVKKLLLKNINAADVDKVYANFYCKCFLLWRYCEQNSLNLDPRQIDNYLISIANEKIPQ